MCNIETNALKVLQCYYGMHPPETFAAFISVFPRAAVSSICSVISCRAKGVSGPWKPATPSCY